MTATGGREWWTAQHVGTSTMPSEVKGERSRSPKTKKQAKYGEKILCDRATNPLF